METHYRHHPRVAPPSEVLLRQGRSELRCRTRDLSLTGCFLETPRSLEGGLVELFIKTPMGGEIVRCRGRVVRSEPRGVAVRFFGLDFGELFGLARLVAPGLA